MARAEERTLALRVWIFLDSIPLNLSARRGSSPSDRFYKMHPKELASVPADEIAVLLRLTADGPTSGIVQLH
jgi:hypothetical protein